MSAAQKRVKTKTHNTMKRAVKFTDENGNLFNIKVEIRDKNGKQEFTLRLVNSIPGGRIFIPTQEMQS